VETATVLKPGPAGRWSFGGRPLVFEENVGQFAESVKFVGRGDGYAVFLTADTTAWVWQDASAAEPRSHVVRMRVSGARRDARVRGEQRHHTQLHYYGGDDPARWQTGIPTFGRVRHDDIYPGIALDHYGRDGRLEYDFVLAPGADPSNIALDFDGIDRLTITASGNLILNVGQEEVVQQRPVAYQVVNGLRQRVDARFVRRGATRVAFELGAYERAEPLVIDPVLAFSTFVGGTGGAYGDHAYGIATDSAENVYVVGWTNSIVFPVGSSSTANGSGEAFVMKFGPAGDLIYTTRIGGSGIDSGEGLAVDGSGQVAFAGWTDSTDFPTVNPVRVNMAGRDAFLAKLDASGLLVFSTYVGGNGGSEYGEAVVFDPAGNVLLTGSTNSTNFPVLNPLQPVLAGNTDGYVLKVDPAGNLLYGTYLGGSGADNAESIALDSLGSFVVTGFTGSSNFPTLAPFQPDRGGNDVYVTKFAPDGASLVFSTYLGGSSADGPYAIMTDAANRIYVAGRTDSTDFPLVNATQGNRNDADVFITRFSELGAVDFSTYLGGSGWERALALSIADQRLYVAGETGSVDFPVANPVQATKSGAAGVMDAFVTAFDLSAMTLDYSTFIGGLGTDQGRGVAAVSGRNVFVAGWTESDDFPLVGPLQDHRTATGNVFLARLAPYGVTSISPRAGSTTGGDSVTIHGQGFEVGSSVLFGGVPATGVFVGDSTWITALTPAHSEGKVHVTVLGLDGGAGTLYDGFSYRVGSGPVADAGPDLQVEASGLFGGLVMLDATRSYDPDGGTLTYVWTEGATVLGTGSLLTVALPVGAHEITLSVGNGSPNPGTDVVRVTVVDTLPPGVTVITPNGGNTLYASVPTVLEWAAGDSGSSIASYDVYLSTDAGVTYAPSPICADVPGNLRECTWTPAPATTKGRIKVVARDSAGNLGSDSSDGNFTVTVTGTPSVKVTAPNTAVNWGGGSTQTVAWTHNLGSGAEMNLEVSVDGGSTWTTVAARVRNSTATAGSFAWTVQTPLTQTARIRVRWNNGAVSDQSDVNFSIAPAFITLSMPTASTNWGYGTRQQQPWATNLGPGDRVEIGFSADGGASFPEVLGDSVVASLRTAAVIAPALPSPTSAARARVRWTNAPDGYSAEAVSPAFRVEPPFVRMTAPNGGERWTVGTNRTLSWAHNLGALESVRLELSQDDGGSYPVTLLASTPSDGSQGVVLDQAWATPNGRVRVSWLSQAAVSDESDASFAIDGPFIALTSPNGGETWAGGTPRTITWSSNLGSAEKVKIELSLDGGNTFPIVVVGNTPADGAQAVTINNAWITPTARIRISWIKDPTLSDTSDGGFDIRTAEIAVTSPNGGEVWNVGSRQTVRWTANFGTAENVRIHLSLDGGATYPITLASSTPSDGAQAFTVSNGWRSQQAKIRITWVKQAAVLDVSDQSFVVP
jgi:hypothetical protein